MAGALRAALLLAAFGIVLALVISPRTAAFFLFHPSREDPGPAPELVGVQGRDLELATPDGETLHAWWFPAPDPTAPAVLFLHGNAGHMGHRDFQARGYLEEGVSVLLLSYRGYGRSTGRPSTDGIVVDAEAAHAWLAEELGDPGRIVLHGRSLGGAAAGVLAGRLAAGGGPEPAGLIVESTFTDLARMARAVYPFLPPFLLRRLRGTLDARAGVAATSAPVLVVHGSLDTLVPPRMGRSLHEAAGVRGTLVEVPGAGHNDLPWVASADYFPEVADFVRRVTAR
jgi:uncharacterized protein